MKLKLKDYQEVASDDVLQALRRAARAFGEDGEYTALSLSAPTGAGKTVIATAVIERLLYGDDTSSANPDATILWITDDPSLNEQTRRKMLMASERLKAAQLVTIDLAFDEATLPAGKVFFLNIQKLGRSTSYVKGGTNLRTYSLWTTLKNTISERGANFYVVIDEAHRGAKPDRNRQTIVSKVISDSEGTVPPSPIVWGISATPERFQEAMARSEAPNRTRKEVPVPIEEVRESGLLKDKILVKHPMERQPAESTLTRLAVSELKLYESQWKTYGKESKDPPVKPILVVQVPAKATDAALSDLLAQFSEAWSVLTDRAVAHTFESHAPLALRGASVRYIQPEDIQDDPGVRVVLFKEALTTGWDCPRAEVMLSLRRAKDYTYIAQLIGRMVRTPLARRIATNDVLNTVALFLPHFNEAHVDDVVQQFKEDPDAPPITVEKNSIECRKDSNVDDEVFEKLLGLPTYLVPGRAHRSQVARLHSLATLLAGDGIDEQAISKADQHLLDTLERERARLDADGGLSRLVKNLATVKYQQKSIDLLGEGVDVKARQVVADARNIDDLLKGAGRTLRDGLAKTFWGQLVEAGEDTDQAKLITAAMASDPATGAAVESAAESLVRTWLRERSRAITELPEARKVMYYGVRSEARESELVELSLPSAITASGDHPRWSRHVYVDGAGAFPAKFTSWEEDVLKAELNPDGDLIAWYRNPTGGERALRVPYEYGDYEKPMYPDFVFFHKTPEGIRPSIVDPHNYAYADAGPKWRGLAAYAAEHGDSFARIDAVISDESDTLLRIDLKDPTVQAALQKADGKEQILRLFQNHGGTY
jgi:type III restriction enzyme